MTHHPGEAAYFAALGVRLRQARKGQGLTLAAAQEKSGGEWPGVVTATYERGQRRISAYGVVSLAGLFGTPPGLLLTGTCDTDAEVIAAAVREARADERARILALIGSAP